MLCLPSANEAFGRVYLEAWSKGKPVIGGRIPAVKEVITDGYTGLLVDAASVQDIERAISALLRDPDLARRLGENGRGRLEAEFSWRQVVARIEQVYETLLARRQTSAGKPT